MGKNRILLITHTAIFIALLVSAQAVTRPLGQFVTGSCVNFILVASCILAGLPSAAIVSIISPMFAFLIIGVPVFPILVPFIMAGNFILVSAIHIIAGKSFAKQNRQAFVRICIAALIGSLLKFFVLWVGIVQIALTLIPGIRQPQIDAMSAAFSWPQLVTALIGSSLAILIMPKLKKALNLSEHS